MLVNPFQVRLDTVPGTRILQESFGLIGAEVREPLINERVWTIQSLYAPLRRRLNGIRAKLMDQKGFVSFCNQRDLEVLLGLGEPGGWCPWAGQDYIAPGDHGWFGLCMDTIDQMDDLFDRELVLIAEHPEGIDWTSTEITRRLHLDRGYDVEDLWIADLNQRVQVLDRETLVNRWIRVARDKISWRTISI